MVKKCCIRYCISESYAGCGISFHSFPKKGETRQKWLDVSPTTQIITKNSVICSRHFKNEDFVAANSRQLLKKDTIPCIFPLEPNKQIQILSNIVIKPVEHKDSEVYEPPAKKCRSDVRNIAVQTDSNQSENILKQKIKVLSQRLKRRDICLNSLKSLLAILKQKSNNFDEVEHIMKNNFVEIHRQINKDKSNKGVRYSKELKQFALSLYFYSSRAYCFLRNHTMLPHPATLRKMLATNECNVGFMVEVFEFLKSENNLENVALIFDSMSIKTEEVYDKHKDKVWGYVDFAGIVPYDSESLATEVLVFQIVSFKRKFKCPIAYFFIDKISASVQAQLIITAVKMLYDIGITVRSLTCDGTASNVATYENLGCNFNVSKIVTNFKHPMQNTLIHCIFDPAHMLKLCRNLFAEKNLSSKKGNIDFHFVTKLHALQDREGLKLANKLNAAHINFMGKKMNVKLAAQTLSSSVANAIDFLRVTNNEEFKNSEATTEYIRTVDRVFDVLNAKSPLGKGFKSPLRLDNKNVWTGILTETREYLSTLNVDNQSILLHRRKMGVLGLIVDTYSVSNLAMDLLAQNGFNYFLPYKFSQDQLEMFFSCVRIQGGGNNNPNALQFRYALRKLLYRNSVTPSMNANCTDDEFELSPILDFRSKKRSVLEAQSSDFHEEEQLSALMYYMESITMSDYKMNILYYIAGYFVNKILDKISCQHCRDALIIAKEHFDHTYFVDITNFSSFTAFVDKGGLKYVSRFSFEVIKHAEKLFLSQIAQGSFKNISKHKIVMILKQMFFTKFSSLFNAPHPVEGIEEPHELQLVKALAYSYLNLRIFHFAKQNSLKKLGSKIGLRQTLTKTILFSHV